MARIKKQQSDFDKLLAKKSRSQKKNSNGRTKEGNDTPYNGKKSK